MSIVLTAVTTSSRFLHAQLRNRGLLTRRAGITNADGVEDPIEEWKLVEVEEGGRVERVFGSRGDSL